MTKAEKIDKIRNLQQAYILYSSTTRLPYVECEQGSYYDQAFFYETREDAEEAARRICENGDLVGVAELKTVEMVLPKDEKLGDPVRNLMRNQVREHLMRLPLLGLNAVFFKPAGENGEVLELDYVLPEEVKAQLAKEKTELSGVELTGIYFAQCLRRKEKDMNQLREYSEEFHANLVRAELLLPVIPDPDHADDARLDLMQCKIPYYPIKKVDSDETSSFLALFTNMDEVAAHCRRTPEKVRVVKIPFKDVPGIMRDPMIGCVIDPLSINIPVRKEDIPVLVEALKD